MTRNQKPQEIIVKPPARFFDNRDKIGRHKEELAHRRHVHHLWVDGYNHSCRRIQGAHRQEAQLRRAVHDNDIVVVFDLLDCASNAPEEQVLWPPTVLNHEARRLMLELH